MEGKHEIIKWVHCNSCNHRTEHLLVSKYRRKDSEEVENGISIWWVDGWDIWECRGCKELTGEKTNQFSEDIGYDGNIFVSSNFYPAREEEILKAKSYFNISDKLEKLYQEIISSYNNSSYILCSIGLRALVEGICVDKQIKDGNLQKKIQNAEFIPVSIRKNLHAFRFLGNDAAHELISPNKEDLQMAIYVIEDILNVTYELDYKSKLIFDKFNKNI